MSLYETLTVVCEGCGRRNTLERPVLASESVVIVCHGCESQIYTEADDDALTQAVSLLWPTE